jgi:hypothetical protein
MKKIKRILAASLILAVLLLCGGCADLDKMRANHAFFSDETLQEIQWQGNKYKRLPYHPLMMISYTEQMVYLTEADVPVLLSELLGDIVTASSDKVLLEVCVEGMAETAMFAREDHYERILQQIKEGPVLSQMNYEYFSEDGTWSSIGLNAAQIAAVEQVLATVPKSLGRNGYGEDYSVYLYRSSEDGYFQQELASISVLSGEYRLICNVDGEDFLYTVPEELIPIYAEIINPYKEIAYTY